MLGVELQHQGAQSFDPSVVLWQDGRKESARQFAKKGPPQQRGSCAWTVARNKGSSICFSKRVCKTLGLAPGGVNALTSQCTRAPQDGVMQVAAKNLCQELLDGRQFRALACGISMSRACLRISDAANTNAFETSAGSEGTP